MPSTAPTAGYGTFAMLAILIVASVWLGTVAQRVVERGSFLKGYYLGNRGLGAWALALTATVQSGGTFMGFPSLVYSHGWIVALWISGYMVVPITGFGVLGKRLAQLSRRTGAITIPDLFRERFGSSAVGAVALWFILLYMSFMMIAQFKAGGLIIKVAWPGSGPLSLNDAQASVNSPYGTLYWLGLIIFSITVVGYTLIGGFLAAVWTDLFQSVMMLVGVVILLLLALPAAGGLENATREAVRATSDSFAAGPGFTATTAAAQAREFLPASLAFSFFFVWVFSGLGSPAGIVRIMASKSTEHIRRSIFMLNMYNACIYIPLVIICICGRALFPAMPAGRGSDEIVPLLAVRLTETIPGGSLLAGLVLAAPFGAVMATVSGYLVVIASAVVHDVYQRFIHPTATSTQIRRLTYAVMVVIGVVAFVANIRPVEYLQAIVVFSGTGAAASFVVPALFAAYWRRATAPGTLTAMIAGGVTMISLYGAGFLLAWNNYDQLLGQATRFRPYYLLGMDPIIWGLLASAVFGVGVSLLTQPPDRERVARMFDVLPAKTV